VNDGIIAHGLGRHLFQGLSEAQKTTLKNDLAAFLTERGETTPALLSQRRSEHHFSDLLAWVSATQRGDGVRVNLELQSL
jgi:hypothetical protein